MSRPLPTQCCLLSLYLSLPSGHPCSHCQSREELRPRTSRSTPEEQPQIEKPRRLSYPLSHQDSEGENKMVEEQVAMEYISLHGYIRIHLQTQKWVQNTS